MTPNLIQILQAQLPEYSQETIKALFKWLQQCPVDISECPLFSTAVGDWKKLPPREKHAYVLSLYAREKYGEKAVPRAGTYQLLRDEGFPRIEGYELPKRQATFERALGRAEKKLGIQRNSSRANRTGRSVVGSDLAGQD